jgi:chromosome segregation ATPase
MKVPGLEDKVKGLGDIITRINKEKQELCGLVSNLREQINDAEEARTDSKNDEGLMREKLKLIVRENEMLKLKVKGLEGMYEAEIGEVKNVEEVIQDLKDVQLELDFTKKNELSVKRDKEELKRIISELKEQIQIIEHQRNHFELRTDQVERDYEEEKRKHEEFLRSARESQYSTNNMVEEVNFLKNKLEQMQGEKRELERENMEIQDRLDENLDKLIELQSQRNSVVGGGNAGALGVLRALAARDRPGAVARAEEDHQRRPADPGGGGARRVSGGLASPEALVHCVEKLTKAVKEEREHVSDLQNQVMDLREAKINLLEKLNELKEEQTSNASLNHSRMEFQSQIVGSKETAGSDGLTETTTRK